MRIDMLISGGQSVAHAFHLTFDERPVGYKNILGRSAEKRT